MNFFRIKIGQWFRFTESGPVYEKVRPDAFRFAEDPFAGPYRFHDKRPREVIQAKPPQKENKP